MSFSVVISLVRYLLGTGLGGGRRGACNVPPLRGLRTGKLGKMYAAMIYIGRTRVCINKKKQKNPTNCNWREE